MNHKSKFALRPINISVIIFLRVIKYLLVIKHIKLVDTERNSAKSVRALWVFS